MFNILFFKKLIKSSFCLIIFFSLNIIADDIVVLGCPSSIKKDSKQVTNKINPSVVIKAVKVLDLSPAHNFSIRALYSQYLKETEQMPLKSESEIELIIDYDGHYRIANGEEIIKDFYVYPLNAYSGSPHDKFSGSTSGKIRSNKTSEFSLLEGVSFVGFDKNFGKLIFIDREFLEDSGIILKFINIDKISQDYINSVLKNEGGIEDVFISGLSHTSRDTLKIITIGPQIDRLHIKTKSGLFFSVFQRVHDKLEQNLNSENQANSFLEIFPGELVIENTGVSFGDFLVPVSPNNPDKYLLELNLFNMDLDRMHGLTWFILYHQMENGLRNSPSFVDSSLSSFGEASRDVQIDKSSKIFDVSAMEEFFPNFDLEYIVSSHDKLSTEKSFALRRINQNKFQLVFSLSDTIGFLVLNISDRQKFMNALNENQFNLGMIASDMLINNTSQKDALGKFGFSAHLVNYKTNPAPWESHQTNAEIIEMKILGESLVYLSRIYSKESNEFKYFLQTLKLFDSEIPDFVIESFKQEDVFYRPLESTKYISIFDSVRTYQDGSFESRLVLSATKMAASELEKFKVTLRAFNGHEFVFKVDDVGGVIEEE